MPNITTVDIAIFTFAITFIVILIILTKISSQIDNISNMADNIQRKIRENNEATKWDFDKIKEKMAELKGEDIAEYMNKKLQGEKDEEKIDWKG